VDVIEEVCNKRERGQRKLAKKPLKKILAIRKIYQLVEMVGGLEFI